MRTVHLFAGAGGSHLAGELLGWEGVYSVEWNAFRAKVCQARFPEVPLHKDVTTFDARGLRGRVDLVVGGFPCTDISKANSKGRARGGLQGEASGLWFEFHRVVEECAPEAVFVENVEHLAHSADLHVVLQGLADLGYLSRFTVNRAFDVGAPHARSRVWILARQVGRRMEVGPVQMPSRPRPPADLWATPTGQDGGNNAGASQFDRNALALNTQVALAEFGTPEAAAGRGILSPAWVSQLMGWPEWYLDLRVPGPVAPGDVRESPRWPARPGQPQHAGEMRRVLETSREFPLRSEAVKALGNAWVPQQAAAAFRQLWQAF